MIFYSNNSLETSKNDLQTNLPNKTMKLILTMPKSSSITPHTFIHISCFIRWNFKIHKVRLRTKQKKKAHIFYILCLYIFPGIQHKRTPWGNEKKGTEQFNLISNFYHALFPALYSLIVHFLSSFSKPSENKEWLRLLFGCHHLTLLT